MFDTVETITVAIDILAGMLNTMTVNDKHMAESTEKDFSNATELADYLASKGLPFREAHEIVGKLVLECTKAGYYLQDVPLERYQEVSDLVNFGSTYLNLLTKNEYIESTIATSGKDFGNDWNFDRHIIVDSKPTLEDFQKTITDYLSWEIQQVIKSDEKLGK